MSKSDKSTISRRLQDVLRLILAGAEFTDIKQYAKDQGWQVSERQLRRYIELAYRKLGKLAQRDRTQLLGRHLMQRRTLYARELKTNDIRVALQVLRDEAELQGIYPPTKVAPTTPDGLHPYPGPVQNVLTLEERLARLLVAEAQNDSQQKLLLDNTAPQVVYRLPETQFPMLMLNVMALLYANQQLEAAATVINAMYCGARAGDADWDWLAAVSAYEFKVGREGWLLFCSEMGFDGEYLVSGNYGGWMLETYGDAICAKAPTVEELRAIASALDMTANEFLSAGDVALRWRRVFARVCGE